MTRSALRGCAMLVGLAITASTGTAQADQLFDGSSWSAMASDERAGAVGDILTVVVSESARASSELRQNSSRSTDIGGSIGVGSIDESATLDVGGSYSGRGEVTRTEQFITQMSAEVVEVLANGDLVIQGQQHLVINGENTRISVRGKVRPQDIVSGNYVFSSRIAQAQIDYDGKGFVSRSAKPGLINRIFSFLGLG